MINWKTITLKDLAGYISESLRRKGIETILVGGACVTIYSENRYQSYDLDFVTYEDMGKVKKALNELGFKEKSGYFQHLDCEWFIEFVSPPVAVGNEFIKTFGMCFASIKMAGQRQLGWHIMHPFLCESFRPILKRIKSLLSLHLSNAFFSSFLLNNFSRFLFMRDVGLLHLLR
ncbi:MAG: hypothetical protein LW832_01985, partial [Parachlamydia sp.]|nr:hypothetical protein [Parachlamydia sp.]